MNRIIKFRAWHPGVKKAFVPEMLYDEKSGDCLRWLAEGQPIEVMQFTGLTDKDGKDIYEGDISTDGGIVEWNTDSAAFVINYPNIELQSIDAEISTWFKLAGNLYEHPHLINQQ